MSKARRLFRRTLLLTLLAAAFVFFLALVAQTGAESGLLPRRESEPAALAERLSALPPQLSLLVPRGARFIAEGLALAHEKLRAPDLPENALRV